MTLSKWRIVPDRCPVKFRDCPPGLFQFGGSFHLKTEYGNNEAFVVDSGECFWGGTNTEEDRGNLIVIPSIIEATE